jgi:hypothetical protein
MRSGTKLWSAVCETEVIVIRGGDIVVECGGSPMIDHREGRPPQRNSAANPAFAHGTKIGKRYVDGSHSVELLCVKAGVGSLSIGGVALQLKEAKPLPASD